MAVDNGEKFIKSKVYCAYIICSAMKLKKLTCKVKLGIYWCYINMEDDTFNLES